VPSLASSAEPPPSSMTPLNASAVALAM